MTGGSGRQAPPPTPTGRRIGAASSGAPPIDPAVVDSLRRLGQRSGRDVFGELTRLFLSTTETQVATAWSLVDRHDHAQLARVAHSLKGSSSVIGGRRVAAAAAELEELALGRVDGCVAPGPDSAPDLVDDAAGDVTRAALARFVAELERFRAAVEELTRSS